MTYTVKQLASMSGISVRTLHWYDTIDLLKPAYYGNNGSRHYEEEQVLRLQQILFFRELGFSLDEIQTLLKCNNAQRIRALQAHMSRLEQDLNQNQQMIETIQKTLSQLRGKEKMSKKDVYNGFDAAKRRKEEKATFHSEGSIAEQIIGEHTPERVLDDQEKARIEREGNMIYQAVAECLDQQLTPRCAQVQKWVDLHFHMLCSIHSANKEVYLAYAELYAERAPFREQLEKHHANLPLFMAEAMRVYAHKNL